MASADGEAVVRERIRLEYEERRVLGGAMERIRWWCQWLGGLLPAPRGGTELGMLPREVRTGESQLETWRPSCFGCKLQPAKRMHLITVF